MSEPIPCRSAAEFAAHLTAIRIARGVSQADLAAVIAVPQVSLWRWETGRTVPTVGNAIRHAAGLGYGLALVPLPRPPLVVDAHLPDEDVL